MQQLGNTSMYIDSFLDRSLNATEMALGIIQLYMVMKDINGSLIK